MLKSGPGTMYRVWKSLLVLAVFTCTVYGQNTPTITQDIRQVVKPAGETGKLLCYVQIPLQSPESTVSWSQDLGEEDSIRISKNEEIDIDFNPTVLGKKKYEVNKRADPESQPVIDPNTGRATPLVWIYELIINNLQVKDDGTYECRASWQGDIVGENKKGKLEVQLRPSISAKSTSNAEVNQGQTAVFSCIAEGTPRPTISWTKGSDNQLPETHNITVKYLSNKEINSTLVITNVTTADAGLYRCTADNTVIPVDEHGATLNVRSASTIWTGVDVYQGVLGTYGKVECYGRGHPPPVVTWYYLGTDKTKIPEHGKWEGAFQSLTEGSKYQHIVSQNFKVPDKDGLSTYATYFALSIKTLDANDFGYYGCLGTNDIGESSATPELYWTNCKTCGGGSSIEHKVQAVIGGGGSGVHASILTVFICSLLVMLQH